MGKEPWPYLSHGNSAAISYIGLPSKALFKQVFVIKIHLKVLWVGSTLSFLQPETSMTLLLSIQDNGGGILLLSKCVKIDSHSQEEAIKFLLGGPRLPAPPLSPALTRLHLVYSIPFGNLKERLGPGSRWTGNK